MIVRLTTPHHEGYRYGPMCWSCRSFHMRLHGVCSECEAWLCSYCAVKHDHAQTPGGH